MAAAQGRWLSFVALSCVLSAFADDKKIESDWLTPNLHDEVAEIESAASPRPATKEQIKQLLAKRRVVGRVLKVNGKIEGYVVYALQPDGYHILRMTAYDKGESELVASKLVNELR